MAWQGYGLYASGSYGVLIGETTDQSQGTVTSNKALGITTDPTKSGIIASLANLNIGEVNALKLGEYILKY